MTNEKSNLTKIGRFKEQKDTRLLKLRYWRERVGLKQDDLALLLGCKRANYSQKENGRTNITLTEMLKIQNAINKRLVKMGLTQVTLDDLFIN